jgi:hypothetical protein
MRRLRITIVETPTKLAMSIRAIFLSIVVKSSTIDKLLNTAMLKTVKSNPGMSDKNVAYTSFVGPKIIQKIEAYGIKSMKNKRDHFMKSFSIGAMDATKGPGPREKVMWKINIANLLNGRL